MAKTSAIQKNLKRIKLVKKYAKKCCKLQIISDNNNTDDNNNSNDNKLAPPRVNIRVNTRVTIRVNIRVNIRAGGKENPPKIAF